MLLRVKTKSKCRPNGTAVKEGTIIKQKGSKRFVVAETGADDTEYTCTLKTGVLPAALSAGEMSIMVLGNDAETYTVSKITGRKVTVVAPCATGTNALDGTSLAYRKWPVAVVQALCVWKKRATMTLLTLMMMIAR